MITALSIRALTRRMHAGLSARFLPFQALTDVSLDVHPGELVALVGPPGAGKSTLLRCAAGELSPTTGRILWFGVDARAGVIPAGVIKASNQLSCRVSTRLIDALRPFVGQQALPAEAVEQRLAGALEQVGLLALGRSRVDCLSAAAHRRFILALSLIRRPRLLLIDGLLDALDPRTSEDLLRALYASAERGVAVLLATRESGIALDAHRQLSLVDGRLRRPPPSLVTDRPPFELTGAPPVLGGF